MNVFTAIRKDARDWWYHAKLRKEGEIQKARELENKSTRGDIDDIRKAYYVLITHGGHTIYINDCKRIEGYKGINHPSIQFMITYGIPVIDITTVNLIGCKKLIRLPLVAVPPVLPDNKFGSFNYESLEYVASKYKEVGATIYNVKGVSNE